MRSKKIYFLCLVFSVAVLTPYRSASFDRSVFYRVSSFWDEARLERPSLGSYHLKISGGHTNEARNGCAEAEDLLCLFVPHGCSSHCRYLDACHACFDKDNPLMGIFDILEADFNLWQNLRRGLFWHFHLPVIATDLFNTSVISWSQQHPYHLACAAALEQIAPQNLCQPIHKRGVGDASLFFGITRNYEETVFWDFVDGTLELGILFPTAQKKDVTQLFDIPYGYNGHWGLTWTARCAIGAYEWLTMGLAIDGVFLFSRKESIFHNERAVRLNPGSVIRGGGYFRLDRIVYGISALFAFNYERKSGDSVNDHTAAVLCATTLMRHRWSRTMFHLLFEWDFSPEFCWYGSCASIGYNAQLRGRNVFKTNMVEGRFFFEIAWCF